MSKRTHALSRAETLAVALSKSPVNNMHYQRRFRLEGDLIKFPQRTNPNVIDECTWRGDACYCKKAELKFETQLPDRRYLTRYSVRCDDCFESTASALHLHCGLCDEVLTGSIAGPGGKVTDHLITIRHVYQQAMALKTVLDQGRAVSVKEHEHIREYVAILEEWSDIIRFPARMAAIRKTDFGGVLTALKSHLIDQSIQILVS
jgi:hypothetical protein